MIRTTLAPSICKSELVWPSYSLCKITVSFLWNVFFALSFILSILLCAIMPGFHKSGHKCGDSENSLSYRVMEFSNNCLLFLFSWKGDFWLAARWYWKSGEPSTLHHEQTILGEKAHPLFSYIMALLLIIIWLIFYEPLIVCIRSHRLLHDSTRIVRLPVYATVIFTACKLNLRICTCYV